MNCFQHVPWMNSNIELLQTNFENQLWIILVPEMILTEEKIFVGENEKILSVTRRYI